MGQADRMHASPWIQRWSHLVPAGSGVLDVACGPGRHMQWFASAGCLCTGVDRDEQALESARQYGTVVHSDLENDVWPLSIGNKPPLFEVVVVTNYLWRPLFPSILASLAPAGLLLYETFAHGNAAVGRPSRAEFLLQPGELLALCQPLRTIAYEDGYLAKPDRFVQRIAAVNAIPTTDSTNALPRYPLSLE